MNKKIVKMTVTLFLAISTMSIKSNAATQIEIVPNEKGIRNETVSTAFITCRNLDSLNSTLGTTALDPHLVTNADFGAVSYLANSDYGVGASGHTSEQGQGKCGYLLQVSGIDMYSTTPNITGIMNWGANPNSTTYMQTSGLLSDVTVDKITNTETKKNVLSLLSFKDTRYVDSLAYSATNGMAIQETTGWGKWSLMRIEFNFPMCIRNGLFGYGINSDGNHGGQRSKGGKFTDVTFRPVIWNN